MRLLKRHSDEDEASVDGAPAVETDKPAEPERRVVTRRPADTAEQPVVDQPARAPWHQRFRRTETVPMTFPRRSFRRTVSVPARRVEPGMAQPTLAPASILSTVAGGALAVVGIVTLIRTGLDETWFSPRVEVLDANHTALLGAIEAGVGVLFVLLGLAGSRYLVAMGGIAGALVATAAAVEPEPLNRELAIESWWAWVLAGAGVILTLVALQAPRARPSTVIDVR